MAGVRVRLTDRDLEKLSKTAAGWTILRSIGQDAQQAAKSAYDSDRLAASVWVEFIDIEGQPAHIEVRAGSLPGQPAPYSRAFFAAMYELGTVDEPPRPVLHPSVEQAVVQRGGSMSAGRTHHSGR